MFLCEKPLYLKILTFLTIRKHIEERHFILLQGGLVICTRDAFIHMSLYDRACLKDTLRGLVAVTPWCRSLGRHFNSRQLPKGRILI